MSSSLITNSLRLLRISSHVKWQTPVVAAVRHYGKWAAAATPTARRDFITGIDTHTHIDTFVSCSQSAQTILQTDKRAEHGYRVWGYVGPPQAEDAQWNGVHSEERASGNCRGHRVRQPERAHRTFPHAHLGTVLHRSGQPQQADKARHSQLSAEFRGHRHSAVPVWCK